MPNNPLRRIPSVNELLESPSLKNLVDKVSHHVVVAEVRTFLDDLRTDLQQKANEFNMPNVSELADRIADWIAEDQKPSLQPVINATGIVLHTGLGRSPLAKEALHAIQAISSGYASVEVDLESGERSQRVVAVEKLLRELTGAEAALVVNNNAGATLLALAAIGSGQEVIVSRGHLVEIGGSYRLPEVMEVSGAILREVGTTNKTRIQDYERAINEQTGALLRVHPSNYLVTGFTSEASLKELVELGKRKNLPVIDDIGSGATIDFARFGLAGEPIAGDSITAGADVVLFSGDKLLGGPQCGILIGQRDLIDQITKHPLTRALRVDKMTLAALAATLRLYRDPEVAQASIPLLQLLNASEQNLQNRAERLAPQLQELPAVDQAEAIQDVAYLGGGSVPTQQLPTWCIAITPSERSVNQFAAELRTSNPSIFGRIQQNRLLLDLRAVFPAQDLQILEAIRELPGRASMDESESQPTAPDASS
ncbi:MAG: L-seryl-tRNA(Sec) selenium transferase [Planctomycetaceae bacterium]|nr:L-seryl-tRNA(Sec) selenium transferase [Planctomycetaceae bacterium]